MEETNFINNSQSTNGYALITTDGPTLFRHCTFLENDENPTHAWLQGTGIITLNKLHNRNTFRKSKI